MLEGRSQPALGASPLDFVRGSLDLRHGGRHRRGHHGIGAPRDAGREAHGPAVDLL
ncbi:hypothetical protein ACFFX0_03600 [Citricoccus parietis]|uniref:Uncharacterized protein n=1 Tax=Citricoccus parietis TaxID=592307 RepID=A0ABV5FUF5_9MICC